MSLQRSHDRATIGPRSRLDCDLDSQTTAVRSCAICWKDHGLDSALKEPRSRLDLTAIAVRSHHDRRFLPRIFAAVRWKSDAPCVFMKRRRLGLTVAVRSRSRGLHVDEDKRSSCRHVASGTPFDRRHLSHILRTWLFDDRVDSGPRDLRRPDRIQRLQCRHVACKRETCGNIVPHGEKHAKH